MSSQQNYRRANISVTIPEGTKLVTFGDYFVARFTDLDVNLAKSIDALFSRLSPDHLKRLSAEIISGGSSISSSYSYLTAGKQQNREKDPEIVASTASTKNYDAYVGSAALKSMSLVKGMSVVSLESGNKTIPFVFKDGVVSVELNREKVLLSEVKDVCVKHFEDKGKSVEIFQETILDKVVQKACNNNPVAIEVFKKDDRKVVSGISLIESAELFSNGKISGKVGNRVERSKMSPEVLSYLSSSQLMKAMFIDSKGRNMQGNDIPHSSEFMQAGPDIYKLGYNNLVTATILNSVGIAPISDIDAKTQFFSCMESAANYYKSVKMDSSVERPELLEYIPFNFGWVAEEYKKSKSNPDTLNQFKLKYELMFRSRPMYCGKGDYNYVMHIDLDGNLCNILNFFRLPNIVAKLMGHYTILSCFSYGVPLTDAIRKFFLYNESSMSKMVMSVFALYENEYQFEMTCMGTSEFTGGWEDDGTNDYIKAPSDMPTDTPYVAFGPDVLSRSKGIRSKTLSSSDSTGSLDQTDSDQNGDEYKPLVPRSRRVTAVKGDLDIPQKEESGDVDYDTKMENAPRSKLGNIAGNYRDSLARRFDFLTRLDVENDYATWTPDLVVRMFYYQFFYMEIDKPTFEFLCRDYTMYLDACDDSISPFEQFQRFVRKFFPKDMKALVSKYEELVGDVIDNEW